MRLRLLPLITSLVFIWTLAASQVGDDRRPSSRPPLPDSTYYLDTLFQTHRRQAIERFLNHTRLTPFEGSANGIYLSPHPVFNAYRLESDTVLWWIVDNDPEYAYSSVRCTLRDSRLVTSPDPDPIDSTSSLDLMIEQSLPYSQSFEFHRVDDAVFMVNSEVLPQFAEYFINNQNRDVWQNDFLQQVYRKVDSLSFPPSAYEKEQEANRMAEFIYGFTFLLLWFGGSIYASIQLKKMASAIDRIERKLDSTGGERPSTPA